MFVLSAARTFVLRFLFPLGFSPFDFFQLVAPSTLDNPLVKLPILQLIRYRVSPFHELHSCISGVKKWGIPHTRGVSKVWMPCPGKDNIMGIR